MTTAYTDPQLIADGVYAPQADTHLLIAAMENTGVARGRRVADLCTGSGAVAIAACEQGAAEVTAFDICPRAVRWARTNAAAAGVDVAVHLGSWARSAEFGPHDVVVCNPPYVPHDPDTPSYLNPTLSWDAGYDGRLVLDPLCATANELLVNGGTLMLVQSEFALPRETLTWLAGTGLETEVIAKQWIPFGPVLSSRAEWLEETGRLERGRREEELVVIRAGKP